MNARTQLYHVCIYTPIPAAHRGTLKGRTLLEEYDRWSHAVHDAYRFFTAI